MMNAGSSVAFTPQCFSVYSFTNASYNGRPIKDSAFSSRLRGSPIPSFAASAATQARASAGDNRRPNSRLMAAKPNGSGYTLPLRVAQTVWR